MQPGRTCIDHINYYVARKKPRDLKEMSVKSSEMCSDQETRMCKQETSLLLCDNHKEFLNLPVTITDSVDSNHNTKVPRTN